MLIRDDELRLNATLSMTERRRDGDQIHRNALWLRLEKLCEVDCGDRDPYLSGRNVDTLDQVQDCFLCFPDRHSA